MQQEHPEKQQERGKGGKQSVSIPNLLHVRTLFLDIPNVSELPLPFSQQCSLSELMCR